VAAQRVGMAALEPCVRSICDVICGGIRVHNMDR